MKAHELENFIADTYRSRDQLLNPVSAKDERRYGLALELLTKYKGQKINILTLPSAWWNFEKLLTYLNKEGGFDVTFHFTAAEINEAVFLSALDRMPRLRDDFQRIMYSEGDISPWQVSNSICDFYNEDIFQLIRNWGSFVKFDFIWLDLMCTIPTVELGFIKTQLYKVCLPHTELAITYVNARDMMNKKTRRTKLNKLLKGQGFHFVKADSYRDGAPMSLDKYSYNGKYGIEI